MRVLVESRLQARILAALGLVAAPGCVDDMATLDGGAGGSDGDSTGAAPTSGGDGTSSSVPGDPSADGDDGDDGEAGDDSPECGAPVSRVVCVPVDGGTSTGDGESGSGSGTDTGTTDGEGSEGSEEGGLSCEGVDVNDYSFCVYTMGDVYEEDGQCCRLLEGFQECCDGRPFIVEHEARTASAVERDDWRGVVRIDVDGLDPELRRRLAAAWQADALMEHASIASFSRFILHLVGLGAPPDLLCDAQQAIADEIEHARTCFALASAYAGRPIGPGPIDVDDALGEPVTLVSAAVAAVREGCIGETLAAYQAEIASAAATEPTIVAALQTIAFDEARHAALAWRFVAWAIAEGGDRVRVAVAEAFAAALTFHDPDEPAFDLDAALWRAHGRLTPGELSEVLARGHREVVEPCALALLGTVLDSASGCRRSDDHEDDEASA